MKFLHLNDSAKYIPKWQPSYDSLYKLQPFVDSLLTNFKAAYTLVRELVVDEAMIGLKGAALVFQYLPEKK